MIFSNEDNAFKDTLTVRYSVYTSQERESLLDKFKLDLKKRGGAWFRTPNPLVIKVVEEVPKR